MCIQCLHMEWTLCVLNHVIKLVLTFNLYRRIADIVLIMMNDDDDDMNL